MADNCGGGIFLDFGVTVSGNTISNNSARNGSGIFALSIYNGRREIKLLNNTIIGNTSTLTLSGGVEISSKYVGLSEAHYNSIYQNSPYDVIVLPSSEDISGTNNYWGTTSNVDILAHVIDFYDDANRGRFLYIPYLQDPDANAPVPPPRNLRVIIDGSTASLTWDAVPSTTTGYGYKIYYKTGSSGPPYNGTGLAQGDSPIDVGNATNYTLTGLGDSVYYMAVATYDTQGHVSWYSNEANTLRKVYVPFIRK